MIKTLNEGFDKVASDDKTAKESLGGDVAKYQRWVDYDMKRYEKISQRTKDAVRRAGLSIVKDQYGDYEVIAKAPIEEAKRESQEVFSFSCDDGIYDFFCATEGTRYGFRHLCDVFHKGNLVGSAVKRYYNRTWESYRYQSVLLAAADDIVGISDECRNQLKDHIENKELAESKSTEEGYSLVSPKQKTLVKMFSDFERAKKEAEELGLKEAGRKEIIGGAYECCFWNKTGDRKDDEEVIAYYGFEHGKPRPLTSLEAMRIADRFGGTFDDINESIEDDDISDDEYYAELERHIKEIPTYSDRQLRDEYKEFKGSTHEDDKRVEDALIKELKRRGIKLPEGMRKHLKEDSHTYDSPYQDLIGEHFGYSGDFDFLDVVADVLDRIDDFSDDDDIYSAVDDGLTYTDDQWKILKHYCDSPADADWDAAFESFLGDIRELSEKISESEGKDEDEEEEEVEEKLSEKPLTESTANFGTMESLPLLIFDDYNDVYERIYDEASKEFGEDADQDEIWERAEELFDEQIDYCTLTEEEQDEIKDRISMFNSKMRDKYSDEEIESDIEVEIKPGYYEAAQLYCNDKYLSDEQKEDVRKFFEELKKYFHLTELKVAYSFSNGETGYEIVKEED